MNSPSISVVIPLYNAEKYVAEAVQSVLAQTVPVDEIILVDDGSTDGSAAVAGQLGPVTRLLTQTHGGTGAARNTGVQAASGDLIAFLDADDLWLPDKLARQLPELAAGKADMIFGWMAQFYSPELNEEARSRIKLDATPMAARVAGTLLIRREDFLSVGLFSEPLRVGEFIEWCLRADDRGMSSLVLPDVMLQRRLHPGNTGLVGRSGRPDYAQVVKAALDRRRSAPKP